MVIIWEKKIQRLMGKKELPIFAKKNVWIYSENRNEENKASSV